MLQLSLRLPCPFVPPEPAYHNIQWLRPVPVQQQITKQLLHTAMVKPLK
jgi:hypothetical protein